jgi:vancomycin resistance protein YoaR
MGHSRSRPALEAYGRRGSASFRPRILLARSTAAQVRPALAWRDGGFGSVNRMGTPPAGVPTAAARPARGGSRAARLVRSRQLAHSRARTALTSVAAVVLVLLFAAVVERVAFDGQVLPGISVEGADVAGKSEPDAYRELQALAARLERMPIRARAGSTALTADPANLQLHVDAAATLRAARVAGRGGNPVEQVSGALLRRVRDDEVPLRVSYSDAALEGLLDAWGLETADGIVEGTLRFAGTRVVPVEPRTGTGMLREPARRILQQRLRSGDRSVIDLPVGRVAPEVARSEVDQAAARARALLAAPVVINSNGVRLTVTPQQLAPTLGTAVDHHELELTVDPERLRTAMGTQLAQLVKAPVDARFEVTSTGAVNVVPSQAGRELDVVRVSKEIARGEHNVTAPLRSVEPAHDTKWARALGIKELVSTFTTYHPAGQDRVKNIHRAADVIDNLVVEPGHVFSLDDAIGPRTAERGFVPAPVFYGEFTEDYGGGVSQLATTFFNAVFFGGYEDITHKPHTIYISRYPMGRESTINYQTVDVKFRNDSKHGVLIRTSYTSSSITVSFYGDKEGKVVRAEGPNILATRPITDRLINWPLLPAGERKVIEHGYTGYDVENFRIIERPGQPAVRERFFWRYKMLPNQVLVGTAPPTPPTTKPAKPPKPKKPTTSTTRPTTTTRP